MSISALELVQARITLLESRLQLVSDELSTALARLPADAADAATANGREPEYPADLSFDADSLSQFAQGFYPREYDESGQMFRWTGNGPICELRFNLDRSEDRTFRMDLGTTPAAIASEVSGFVDYAPITLGVEREAPRRLISGVVPKRAHTRLAVITFLLGRARAKQPQAAGSEGDEWLGFRFYSFAVG
jgi:hypothetical protein